MPSSFSSTLNKQIIRQNWNAPLLDYLKSRFQKKLLYFGLPSPKAEDINDWIDYIDYIIAFQCRDYPHKSDPNQDDSAIRELEVNLNSLQRKKLIQDYIIYDGYIEEVIINGRDNVNLKFELKRFITLYNLDFCNNITFPQTITNLKSNAEENIYKLHVIKKIIDIQNDNTNDPNKFVIFLTVLANLWVQEAVDYKSKNQTDQVMNQYFDKVSTLKPAEKNLRMLKVYVFKTLTTILCSNNFIPEFLPVVSYKGSGGHDLAQFTIICTREENLGCGAIMRQSFEDFIKQGFVSPNEEQMGMIPNTNTSLEEIESAIEPITPFTETAVYEAFWK